MVVKISVTTKCGARCATCPVWKGPHTTMSVDVFRQVWARVNGWNVASKIFLNATGDMSCLENKREYFNIIAGLRTCEVSLTTNAKDLDEVPPVDTLIISFNGSNPENYKKTTGLDFDQVVENIKAAYPDIIARTKYREINCLVWKETKDCEKEFLRVFNDFPGVIRFAYKVENQFGEYVGLEEYQDEERIPCDYLDGITINPAGDVIRCAHDFEFGTSWGNVLTHSLDSILTHPDRLRVRNDHQGGVYPGICQKCNYNVSEDGKYIYMRGR